MRHVHKTKERTKKPVTTYYVGYAPEICGAIIRHGVRCAYYWKHVTCPKCLKLMK